MADHHPVSASDPLPLPRRLALAYAPRRSRDAVLGLWLLDQRLAGILQAQGEVLIAQIKLAWWRDRLGEDPAGWPRGEPLLALLQSGKVPPRSYLPLVDGWEALLAEDLTAAGVDWVEYEVAGGGGRYWDILEWCADRPWNELFVRDNPETEQPDLIFRPAVNRRRDALDQAAGVGLVKLVDLGGRQPLGVDVVGVGKIAAGIGAAGVHLVGAAEGEEEQLEETTLKKKKLAIKDQIYAMLLNHEHAEQTHH